MQSASNKIVLTQSDVDMLLADGSAESRIDIMHKVSDHYEAHNLQGREIEIAEQIFRLLVKDTEMFVRQELATKLKDSADVPRDVVLQLANDHAKVANPILQFSSVLSDADLVQIIEGSKEITKLRAITNRAGVSTRVSGALIETSYPEVATDLLKNEGAEISQQDMMQITKDFVHEEPVLLALAKRAKLPAEVADQLMQHASKAVSEALKDKMDPKTAKSVEKASSVVQENATMKLLAQHHTIDELKPLVQGMHAEKRLTASLIMTALCSGYLNFVRVATAKLANIPVQNATKLLDDSGDLGVRAVYTKTQLPESMYAAVRLLLLIAHDLEELKVEPGTQSYANEAVERLLTHPASKEIENLPYIMALMRR